MHAREAEPSRIHFREGDTFNGIRFSAFDLRWALSLFGTAVGAGILMLPIRAGTGGFYPVVVMTLLIFPMVWLSHRGLSFFVLKASGNDKDITHAVEEYWGHKAGFFITLLYFFAIYPICLVYGVGITNTFGSFFVNQLGLEGFFEVLKNSQGEEVRQLLPIVRAFLAFVLVSALMAVMLLKEETITKICTILVYPLCFVLFAFSIYLIPYWNFESLKQVPPLSEFISVVWLTLPVLVFSFNHSPAISTFTLSLKRKYKSHAEFKSNQILFNTSLMLLVFVMFFVFSCILCLDSQDFALAREANLPILSYFANKFQINAPLVGYGAPLVAFLAITSSFFGHYFGASEGLNGIVRKSFKLRGKEAPSTKATHIFTTIFMYSTLIIVAYVNPSILDFIESLGGPIIATILFIMPLVGFYSVNALKRYRNAWVDVFLLITGLLTIFSVVYKMTL
ncbi:HAAAP family serine/threonine permease [Helicobacter sp. MIT 00-7814]|uniref:aromatic amino acid transport family protein n=1 Tax=unclassified Helicobacter TaxID=2593540 RepID=UPI000E1E8C3D|nr:HAAAP family serine/threonine permease [Helicobacter sp. MIT 00-7814]RDU54068.1 HAAAP family serine/threonine permease [Helicobacter sp. MIT 99-10781]